MINIVAVSIDFYCLTIVVQHFLLQNTVQLGPLLTEHVNRLCTFPHQGRVCDACKQYKQPVVRVGCSKGPCRQPFPVDIHV